MLAALCFIPYMAHFMAKFLIDITVLHFAAVIKSDHCLQELYDS